MKANRFVLGRWLNLLAAILLVSALVFTGCKTDSDDDDEIFVTPLEATDGLVGTWSATSSDYVESYTITTTTFSAGVTYPSYEGNSLLIAKTSNSSGYIYIKYTKSMNADYTYSETAPDVGKWYAISYKDLTSDSISLSGAYLLGGVTSTNSIEEAVKTFTIDNGYFEYYSELKRTK